MNKLTHIALCLMLLIPMAGAQGADEDVKVINGGPADPGEFPEFVGINTGTSYWGHVCGGSLISAHWVLTAAHCVSPILKGAQSLLLGLESYDPLKLKEQLGISQVIMYPSYNGLIREESSKYDIALIKLSRAASSTDYVLLDGYNKDTDPPTSLADLPLTVIGFGSTETGYMPNVLYKVTSTVLPDESCLTAPAGYPPTNFDPEKSICSAAGHGGGDSGGPLFTTYNGKRYQVGVVTRSLAPGAYEYSRISYYADWIKANAVEE